MIVTTEGDFTIGKGEFTYFMYSSDRVDLSVVPLTFTVFDGDTAVLTVTTDPAQDWVASMKQVRVGFRGIQLEPKEYTYTLSCASIVRKFTVMPDQLYQGVVITGVQTV